MGKLDEEVWLRGRGSGELIGGNELNGAVERRP